MKLSELAALLRPSRPQVEQDKTKSVNVLSRALAVAAALTRFGNGCGCGWGTHGRWISATVHIVVGGRFTFIHISADPRRVHFFPLFLAAFCADVQRAELWR